MSHAYQSMPIPGGIERARNKYAYVGQPTRFADPLGLWSTEAHNYFINEFAREMPQMSGQWGYIEQMMAGSRFSDSSAFQSAQASYMHAMSSSTWSTEEARKMTCSFVRSYVGVYRNMIHSPNPADWGKAYFYLGMAMHAVMDSTSPAHRGFQYWGGVGHSVVHGYGQRHGSLPTSIEDLNNAPAYRSETLNLMKKVLAGDMSGCGCN